MEEEESIEEIFVPISIWAKQTIWEQCRKDVTLSEFTIIQELMKKGDSYAEIEQILLSTEGYRFDLVTDTQDVVLLNENNDEHTIELYLEDNLEINGELIRPGQPYLTNKQTKNE